MSRLIDTDELIEWINEQREQVTKKQVAGTDGSIFTREALVTMQRCISTFEKKINNTPTAFDTEKVVEQLEDKTDFLKDCTKYGNKDAEQQEKSYSTMMMYEVADLVEDLIDIVKKGGVE